ncbi:TPA: hypothetical protein LR347_004656 [Enterobacter hormaechei]|nr:hypothetical protein [Enterobacter hormaechei]
MISKINKTLVYSWLGTTLSFGGFLIILPMATAKLTISDLNFWLYSTTLLAIGAIVESSIFNPFTRLLIYAKEKKTIYYNRGAVGHVNGYNSSLIFSLISCLVLSLFVFLIVFMTSVLTVSNNVGNNILFLISVTCLFKTFNVYNVSILLSKEKILTHKKIVFFISLAKTIFTILILINAPTINNIMLTNLSFTILEAMLCYVCHKEKIIFRTTIKEQLNIYNSISGPVFKTFIIRVGGYFIGQSMAMLSQSLPLEDSTALLFSLKCVTLIYRFSLIPSSIKIPLITKLRANGNSIDIRKQLMTVVGFSTAVYWFGSICMIIFGNCIFSFFEIRSHFINFELLIFLCIIYFLELHHVIHSMFYETTNNIPFLAISIFSGGLIIAGGLLSIKIGNLSILTLLLIQFFVQLLGNNWFPVLLNLKSVNLGVVEYLCGILRLKKGK